MHSPLPPLLTVKEFDAMSLARKAGLVTIECSLDLQRSVAEIELRDADWAWQGRSYPYPKRCKPRTVYYWTGADFEAVARYGSSLIKLVATDWGPPTFEIDGIKMLPTARISPYEDAQRKVALVRPQGKRILDTCAGLGYFAAWCVQGNAAHVQSYEKNPDVLWLRQLNPWSPADHPTLDITQGDVAHAIAGLATDSYDAVLHDPPRFSVAGELYSLRFYDELARVLRRRGRLFHYTGRPNQVANGRDLAAEVIKRLQRSGFAAEAAGDGVLAIKK